MRLLWKFNTVLGLLLAPQAFALGHHCVADQTVTLMPACVYGWQEGDTRSSIVDPWVGGRMNAQSPARMNLADACAGGKVQVVEVPNAASGHVKVSCSDENGESHQYWVNPQFLSCGEMDPSDFTPAVAGTACASFSMGPMQSLGLVVTVRRSASLGEVSVESTSQDPARDSFLALKNTIQTAADRTLSTYAVGQALKQATYQNLGGGQLRNQIVQSFPDAYGDVQKQREIDSKTLQTSYAAMDSDGALAGLENGFVKITESSAELERSFGADCRVNSIRAMVNATEISLSGGLIKPNQVRNTALEKTCKIYRLAATEGARWSQLGPDERKRLQEEWKGELFRSATDADDRSRAIRLILLYGVKGQEDLLTQGTLRTFEGVQFGDKLLALPHDGYFLGGSRAGGSSKGVDCSEWVFNVIRGLDKSSANAPGAGALEIPSTRQFRLFAQMLSGAVPWDAAQVGGLAAYRGCFEAVNVSSKNPPQIADIAISIPPGDGPGHMGWVLDYNLSTGMMETYEAAGGSTGTVTIKHRPAFEPPCRLVQSGVLVPRADLVFLRPRSNPDPSCPLSGRNAAGPSAPAQNAP